MNSDSTARGRDNYQKGYTFEDRVVEAYRLLGYRIQHGRLFSGRQVDIFMELTLGDLRVRRAVECKAGEVTADDIDRFLLKLNLVRKEFPDISGTLVSGMGFTDSVAAHASAVGLQLTSYRDLSSQIMDGPSYAQALLRDIEQSERYRPDLFVEPLIAESPNGACQRV